MKSAFFTLAIVFSVKYAYSEAFDYYESEKEETEELLCSRYFLVSHSHFFTNSKCSQIQNHEFQIPIFQESVANQNSERVWFVYLLWPVLSKYSVGFAELESLLSFLYT